MNARPEVDIDALFEEGTPIDEAMNESVRSAVELHRRMGLPMAVWRDGKVAWVSADEEVGDLGAAVDRPRDSEPKGGDS